MSWQYRVLSRHVRPSPSLLFPRRILHPCQTSGYATTSKMQNLDKRDWNQNEDFFNFTRGRFIINEGQEMAQRRVRFDMNELVREAAKSIDATQCTNVEKCPDGFYNKAYVFTMDDGRQVIGKVPNPNAGIPHYTTASEVATMDFMRNVLGTPVPKVYKWNSCANSSAVGAEFIIMEKISGVPLRSVWQSMVPADKLQIYLQVAGLERAWTSAKFNMFGSLYYAKDLESPHPGPLYVNAGGESVVDPRFAIGPAAGREWTDEGRHALKCDRGPWPAALEYWEARVHREILAIETLKEASKQMVMAYGPGLYQPNAEKKIQSLHWFLKVLPHLPPPEKLLSSAVLWHNDLHDENIFVDTENPSKILGIIDWQSTDVNPLFTNRLDPSFMNCDGLVVGDNLERPELPEDYDSLPEFEKTTAMKLYMDTSMMVVWRRLVQKKNIAQYNATNFQKSTEWHILHMSGRVFQFGEAHFRALIQALQDEWPNIPAIRGQKDAPLFPIAFTESQLSEIGEDMVKADAGIQIMNALAQQLGELWPDKGIAMNWHFEDAKIALREAKLELIDRLAHSDEDRALFETYWPFDD